VPRYRPRKNILDRRWNDVAAARLDERVSSELFDPVGYRRDAGRLTRVHHGRDSALRSGNRRAGFARSRDEV